MVTIITRLILRKSPIYLIILKICIKVVLCFFGTAPFVFKQTDIFKKIKEKALIPNPLTLLDNATNNKWQRMH